MESTKAPAVLHSPCSAVHRSTCFVEALVALGAAACSSSGTPGSSRATGEPGAAGASGSDAVPLGIGESLRETVRQSPDHLAQVAAGLVQQADPAALFDIGVAGRAQRFRVAQGRRRRRLRWRS